MGFHSRRNHYIITAEKFAKNTFSVPDLTNFTLKPYVSRLAPRKNPNPDYVPYI
jgi:hypothetical protein